MAKTKKVSKKTDAPITKPTWYGNIRAMFTSEDITHMRGVGIDLSNYEVVKPHASDIYQRVATHNMPPGRPWSKAQTDTFLNWIKNGYQKGTPAKQVKLLRSAKAIQASRIRKEITSLSSKELNLLKKAFKGIMALPSDDPNSYFMQAGYHWFPEPSTWCMHHVPGYNPWHRAYLLSFEDALRSIPDCENVTLPYWDITQPVPEVLKSAPFATYKLPQDISEKYKKGYTTKRFKYPCIQEKLLGLGVTACINRAMAKTDWEDFHGLFADATNNTIISAHDNGHNSIGPTMQDQGVAAFDPIFWFFHCNWDRLFWLWQKKMQATNLNGLLSTINKKTDPVSYEIFTVPALEELVPFTAGTPHVNTIKIINSLDLDVDYKDPPSIPKITSLTKTIRTSSASQAFSVNTDTANVRVNGLNRLKIPGSFVVHLLKNEKVISSTSFFQPSEVEKCESCVKNAIVHFDFELPLADVSGGKLSIWVEPMNQDVVGDHFPHKLMGNPTVDVRLILSNE